MAFPIAPPVTPMLAKLAATLPGADGYLFEPKWDGFRAIVFRGGPDEIHIQSRDLKPLDRYFPQLHTALLDALPDRCVVDGEIVIATDGGLDFAALQMRLHQAASAWRSGGSSPRGSSRSAKKRSMAIRGRAGPRRRRTAGCRVARAAGAPARISRGRAPAPRARGRGQVRPHAGRPIPPRYDFLRWRPDKRPQDRRYDQLDEPRPYELDRIFSSGSSGS
jgi:hypothetical protein